MLGVQPRPPLLSVNLILLRSGPRGLACASKLAGGGYLEEARHECVNQVAVERDYHRHPWHWYPLKRTEEDAQRWMPLGVPEALNLPGHEKRTLLTIPWVPQVHKKAQD